MKISVVVPSRLAPLFPADANQSLFVSRALAAIRGQSALKLGHQLEILVGVDPGMGSRAQAVLPSDVRVVEGERASQASALNAALSAAQGEVIAILEDDDAWLTVFLEIALEVIKSRGFVSSTQLNVLASGDVLGIFDFPTPSGWVMRRETLQTVGLFDDSFRWHLDNDWLGRLNAAQIPRAHLIEATAPLKETLVKNTRSTLWAVATISPHSGLTRHQIPWPLVTRFTHADSGMAQIERDDAKKAESAEENRRLSERYGRWPC
jgi:glycosyltransferase involved in cell wall biosynthesis